MRWIAMRALVPHHQDVELRQWEWRRQDQEVQIRGEVIDDPLRDRRDEVGLGDDPRCHGEVWNAHSDLPVEPQRAKFLVDGRLDRRYRNGAAAQHDMGIFGKLPWGERG